MHYHLIPVVSGMFVCHCKTWVEAMWSCCVRFSFSPMPQLNSQPVSHELNTPLSLCLSLSFCIFGSLNLTLPQCQRHLMSPCLLPMPTACPATNSACLSGNPLYPSFSLLLCTSCLSIFSLSIPPVCLLCSICLNVCQPYRFSPILWQKVSKLSVAWSVCLICMFLQHLSTLLLLFYV